jgi:N6-L-threonylcarbamoyladenine synthase
MMHAGYPGGPIIEKKAQKGGPRAIKFACSNTRGTLDFSYSGIKTAVLYFAQKNKLGSFKQRAGSVKAKLICDVCASFQDAALNALINKTVAACRIKRISSVIVGGGVAANNVLRKKFADAAIQHNIDVVFPLKEHCMDNAAMIAGLGYHLTGRKRAW